MMNSRFVVGGATPGAYSDVFANQGYGGTGNDELKFSDSPFAKGDGGVGNDSLIGEKITYFDGGIGDDTIEGGHVFSVLRGGAGNDTGKAHSEGIIIADGGQDTIYVYADTATYTLNNQSNGTRIIEYDDVGHTFNLSAFDITYDDIVIEQENLASFYWTYHIKLPGDISFQVDKIKFGGSEIIWSEDKFVFDNQGPTAIEDHIIVNEDEQYLINIKDLLLNDYDEEDYVVEFVDFETVSDHGIISRYDDDTLLYTPSADYVGTDRFYTIKDTKNNHAQGSVSLTINSINDKPMANPIRLFSMRIQAQPLIHY